MSRARIPVALLTAPGGVERSARIARWLDARPAGERWAVLVEGGLGALAAVGSEPGVVAVALGGCACCTGATVLRVTLTRLLRAGGLDRILIVVGAGARPEALAAMLSAPPFDALLEPCAALPGAEDAQRSADGSADPQPPAST